MSCDVPQDDANTLMPRRSKFDKSDICIRCKINRGRLVVRHAVYCKDCFISQATYKFKRILEPSINPDQEKSRRNGLKATGDVLIGVSGGLGSTVLLDLMVKTYFRERSEKDLQHKGTKHPRHKTQVWNQMRACYVEICGGFPSMKDRTEDVRRMVSRYSEVEFVPLRLENAFDTAWWSSVGGSLDDKTLNISLTNEDLLLSISKSPLSPLERLRHFLSSLPTATAVASSISTLTRIMLYHTARATSSSHLLLGTSLTSLSISLISSISQGGGYAIREEMQEEWSSVRLVRPLRDLGIKECAALAWWSQLEVLRKEKSTDFKHSIGGITEDFIMGLERDYPSTVSTIARTCDKLSPKTLSEQRCVLCQRPAQSDIQVWKSQISVRSYSPDNSSVISSDSLTPMLCYACHTTLTSRSSRARRSAVLAEDQDSVSLPAWAQASVKQVLRTRQVDEKEMVSQFREFLLDDE